MLSSTSSFLSLHISGHLGIFTVPQRCARASPIDDCNCKLISCRLKLVTRPRTKKDCGKGPDPVQMCSPLMRSTSQGEALTFEAQIQSIKCNFKCGAEQEHNTDRSSSLACMRREQFRVMHQFCYRLSLLTEIPPPTNQTPRQLLLTPR